MNASREIIIYREELLGASETFIRGQAESLARFQAFYLGLRHVPGLGIPVDRSFIVGPDGLLGKFQRLRFRLWGPTGSLVRQLETRRPVLIHAHFALDACNAITLSRALNVPLIATLHGYDVTMADDQLPGLYLRRRDALRRAAAQFICVSEFIRERAIAQGFPADKISVHYTGIDTHFFSADLSITRLPVVLFAGRLVAKKGCEYLIRAMQRVQEVLPGTRLVVIGDGPLRSELERQAKSALQSFQFLGMQDPSSVKAWMNRASVFCTPSVTAKTGDAEGFGMVFAEAQSMGLPVVSFASGGIPEAVANEETGFLVKEKDWEALAAKLLMLLMNKNLWEQFSRAGEARVRALFDLREQTAALEDIYDEVLTLHAGTTPETHHRVAETSDCRG